MGRASADPRPGASRSGRKAGARFQQPWRRPPLPRGKRAGTARKRRGWGRGRESARRERPQDASAALTLVLDVLVLRDRVDGTGHWRRFWLRGTCRSFAFVATRHFVASSERLRGIARTTWARADTRSRSRARLAGPCCGRTDAPALDSLAFEIAEVGSGERLRAVRAATRHPRDSSLARLSRDRYGHKRSMELPASGHVRGQLR